MPSASYAADPGLNPGKGNKKSMDCVLQAQLVRLLAADLVLDLKDLVRSLKVYIKYIFKYSQIDLFRVW